MHDHTLKRPTAPARTLDTRTRRIAAELNPERPRRAWLARALAAALLLLGGFTAGRASDRRTVVPAEASARPQPPQLDRTRADLASALLRALPGEQARPKVPSRKIVTPPLELVHAFDEAGEQRLREYEQKQGHDLVQLLRVRVRAAQQMAAEPNDLEATVNQLHQYMSGWIDGVVRTAPTLADDLAEEVERALCDPATPKVEQLLYARLGRQMPELTSPRSFDCVLDREHEEGPVLWETLDSWRESGLPEPRALARIAASARDERTLRRLAPDPPAGAAPDEADEARGVPAAAISASDPDVVVRAANAAAAAPPER